jgi:hypothetical protein
MAIASTLGPLARVCQAGDDSVAIQYHFAGTASFVDNPDFALARRLCSLSSSVDFRNFTLDKLAGTFWRGLQFKTGGDPVAVLRPLFDDLLAAESVASFGGANKDHLDFVLAAHLDQSRAQAWQEALASAVDGKGERFTAGGFSGRRWSRSGDNSVWILSARDWMVVGRGEGLQPIFSDYLAQIQKNGWPCPAFTEGWAQAEVNWPRLAAWVPLESCPFKLARTAFEVTSGKGRFRLTGTITYPQELPWSAPPWRFPKDLVHEPLLSFTAARDTAPFLKSESALPHVFPPAFNDQFCCWAVREMPLQTYAAWPVPNGQEALNKLQRAFLPDLNSLLTQPLDHKLVWSPKTSELVWPKTSLMAPSLSSSHVKEGDFMLLKLFPPSESKRPAPADLWSQMEHQDDLVYYDWEFTGPRLQQWRLLCELLPVLPISIPAPAPPKGAARQPFMIVDSWLAGLTPSLGNTVTEVRRSSPSEFTLTRVTPFVFNSFELLWLSHWITDAPAGPVNSNLLPMAKMTGPGVPVR